MNKTPILTPEQYQEYMNSLKGKGPAIQLITETLRQEHERFVNQIKKKASPGRTRYGRRHVAGEMNSTEKRFNDEWIMPRIQTGELIDSWFEEWTFKLADGCRYTPDFVVQDKEFYLVAYEVKGTTKNASGDEIPYAIDDSIVKIKVSPHRFPLQFFIAHPKSKKNGGGWIILEK